MARQVETSIDIEADAGRVWGMLLDFAAYPEWNPFIPEISGEAVVGGRLRALIVLPGSSGMTFKPRVLVADEQRELRWLGRLILPWLADGEHYFRLEAVGGGRTRLIHGEVFRGVLVPFLGGVFARAGEGFRLMNNALKARAEA